MYSIGPADRAVPVEGAPRPPGGPAFATVIGDEHSTLLMYLSAERDRPKILAEGNTEWVVVCRFSGVLGSYFGAPNDEALSNHPGI
jgi:hypothetical protein